MNNPELLRGIANDIRTHGHYQVVEDGDGDDLASGPLWNDARGGQCCVLYNPHVDLSEDRDRLSKLLCPRIDLSGDQDVSPWTATGKVIRWNDETPTDEVLAALERLADELEAAEHADA